MKYIIDVQGFKMSHNEFVFKELAVVALEEDAMPTVWLFKPPYPWELLPPRYKSENRWLEMNFHGILWKSGNIPYDDLAESLRHKLKNSDEVYVKGYEKRNWLQRFLPLTTVYNIEDMHCPALKKLPSDDTSCKHHVACSFPVCAYQNVTSMKKWLLQQKDLQNSTLYN